MSTPPPMPVSPIDYATHHTGFETVCHAEGALIVSPPKISLPHRCVYCNEPEAKRITMKYQWHHPALYLLILAGVLVYAIVALVVQKKGQAELGLCTLHAARRSRRKLLLWLVPLISVGVIVLGPVLENARIIGRDGQVPFILFGILGTIFGLAFAALSGRVLKAKFIDPQMMKLGGAGAPFLQSLDGPPQLQVAQPVY